MNDISEFQFETEQRVGLPMSWALTSLKEVAHLEFGQSPPSSTYNNLGEGLPFFQGKAEFGALYPEVRKWCSSPGKVAEKDDVLISVRAPVGPTNLATSKCCIGRGLAAIRPLGGIASKYALYYLRSVEIELAELGTGTTFGAIASKTLSDFPIPVAPENEQRRLVAKIDELFSQLDAGVANLKRARALLEKYRQAVLKAAVTGELTRAWREKKPDGPSGAETLAQIWHFRRKAAEQSGRQLPKPKALNPDHLWPVPESWAWCSIDEAGDVQLGQQRAPQHHQGQYMRPYLRVANILEDELDLSDVKRMNFEPKELEKFELHPGDILLNEGQSPDLLGRSAIYRGEIDGCCMQKTLLRFRAFSNVLSSFAQIVFRHYMHSGRFRRIARITTNIGHITRIRFVEMEFPLPPTQEQEEIASRFEAIDTNIKYLQRALSGWHDKALKRSILDAAFSGKLVPQSPDDEPASDLIERIRAERAKRPVNGRHGGRRVSHPKNQLTLALGRDGAE